MNQKTPWPQVRSHRWIVVAAIVLFILIIFEVSPFGGNVRFYAKWVTCGEKPLSAGDELILGSNVQYYKQAAAFQPVRFIQPNYFCTPLEAEQAGYSASPNQYEFPHLQQGA